MKNLALLYCGILLLLVAPWCGIVMGPSVQLGGLQPAAAEEDGPLHPRQTPGIAEQGRQVYTSLGCVACHTQQTRPDSAILRIEREGAEPGEKSLVFISPDIERGWAKRGTAATDYIFQNHVLLGSVRVGPDLVNFGARAGLHDTNWLYLHLYDARSVVPGSVMPPFRFLFAKQKVGALPAANALKFPAGYTANVAEGEEIVPSDRAVALVNYLRSLNVDYELPEMHYPKPPAPPAAHAAVAAAHAVSAPTGTPAAGTPPAPAPAAH